LEVYPHQKLYKIFFLIFYFLIKKIILVIKKILWQIILKFKKISDKVLSLVVFSRQARSVAEQVIIITFWIYKENI
jgi:hypothetical protein